MKRYWRGLRVFFSLLLILIIAGIIIQIFWPDWPDKKIISVKSYSEEGNIFVSENKVRFLQDRVISDFGFTLIFNKGQYICDVEYLSDEKFRYHLIDDKLVTNYKLHPENSWWQKFGFFIIIGSGLLLSVFGEKLWYFIFEALG